MMDEISRSMSWNLRRSILLIILVCVWFISLAWVYPEHREISMIAINNLDPDRQRILARLWADACIGYEHRLNELPADSTLGEKPTTLDYAAWPAIAGDHSCSPANLLNTVLETDWIMGVADVAARLKRQLNEAGWERHNRINVLHDSDIDLQKVDKDYVTRAGSNNVHFLLARPDIKTDALTYLNGCLKEGADLNAIGAYAWFHLSALIKASQLNNQNLTDEQRSVLTRAVLADEAFALHFIEDVFAAGHVAGTWGNAALRKGTHDYYNEMGLAVNTWDGESIVLLGDAWMRPEDADRAAEVVRASLEQILDAASDQDESKISNPGNNTIQTTPDTFNVCKVNTMPHRTVDLKYGENLAAILVTTPAPGLSEGLGDLPRFRSEIGPFMGIMSSMYGGTHTGGFINSQSTVGGVGGIEMAFRIGFGIEGVMNESGDGLVFLDLGMRQDGASTSKIFNAEDVSEFGDITAAIPSRSAYLARLRMPYWFIPLDLLIATPFLIFTSPITLANMAVVAGNGGLIGWQTGIATSIGRFQFLLGREISVYFYGYGSKKDRGLAYYNNDESAGLMLIDIRTLRLDFPIFEYRPFRSFSSDQSSSLDIQITGGIEFPIHVNTIEPVDVPDPQVKNIYHIGLRVAFDWRGYF
jgi:hypothetical protein